jgi:serine/threonine protein kinase
MLDSGHTYKADIWSIGILICEMMGGYTPFQNKNEAGNPRAIMEKCRSGRLNLPKNLQGNSRDLVNLLLTDDPYQRPDISQIKEHNFFREINWERLRKRQATPPYIPNYSQALEATPNDESEYDINTIPGESPLVPIGFGHYNNSSLPRNGMMLADIPEMPTQLEEQTY